ncbi:unnamed protein product [Microthlaspi erraticum]|uniref:Uncharacterized protein n=1 Tax=Microthlaspi erraticum TaxID=1685480 RepID=A0A6D2JDC1_9BRAS|nr:unnamed protein product [Microthlaspi erraticum]
MNRQWTSLRALLNLVWLRSKEHRYANNPTSSCNLFPANEEKRGRSGVSNAQKKQGNQPISRICQPSKPYLRSKQVLLEQFYLGSSPISWKTRKQPTVSRSSAEAEYRSMAFALCELKWFKELLLSFGIKHDEPMK